MNKPHMKLILKLLAPYLGVGIFWCIFSNGWLAILAYHAQVLFWSRHSFSEFRGPNKKRLLLTAIPTAIAGPLLYFVLPHIAHTDLAAWLAHYKLTGFSLFLMIPYFGIIHPVIEQMHWVQLREQSPVSHLLFAGYHMMVLASLLKTPWLIASFIALAVTSIAWQHITRKAQCLSVAALSHILADFGVILTATFMLR
jgi:hypothetical protein